MRYIYTDYYQQYISTERRLRCKEDAVSTRHSIAEQAVVCVPNFSIRRNVVKLARI
jgi:hypothetical protein